MDMTGERRIPAPRQKVWDALNDPQIKPKLTEQGFEVVTNTPEQFARFLTQELARWKSVIEVGKITTD